MGSQFGEGGAKGKNRPQCSVTRPLPLPAALSGSIGPGRAEPAGVARSLVSVCVSLSLSLCVCVCDLSLQLVGLRLAAPGGRRASTLLALPPSASR